MNLAVIGPIFVLIGVLVSALVLLVGYLADWSLAERVGPGPDGRPDMR